MAEPRQFVSPYAAAIEAARLREKELTDAPVPPMFTPEQITARRSSNQFDEEMALLAKLSGSKQLQTLGATLLPRALDASKTRITEHGEFNPMSGDHTLFPQTVRTRNLTAAGKERERLEVKEYDARRDFDRAQERADDARGRRADALLAGAPGRESAEELRQLRIDEARRKAEAAAEGKPLTGKPYKDLSATAEAYDSLQQIKTATKDYDPTNAYGVSPLAKAQDVYTQMFPGYASDKMKGNQQAWAAVQRLSEMGQRHTLFGATLTDAERTSWESVTPARGWSKKQLDDWITTRENIVRNKLKTTTEEQAAAGANKGQLEELSRGEWTRPKKAEASTEYDFVNGKLVPRK